MIKAVAYVRVSSKDQEREGFSIPAQKKLLQDYASKHGFRIVELFEEAETAKRAGRHQFGRMIEYIRKNNISDLLVEKTDRLYRNFMDYCRIDPEQMTIRLHFVKENEVLSRDSRSHQKLSHGLKVLMAKNYIDNLSEEVKKGQMEKASQGVWPSCVPLGYRNRLEDHTIVVDPADGPFVRRAFELAATGQYSLTKLKKNCSTWGSALDAQRKSLARKRWREFFAIPCTTVTSFGRVRPTRGSMRQLLISTYLRKLKKPWDLSKSPS